MPIIAVCMYNGLLSFKTFSFQEQHMTQEHLAALSSVLQENFYHERDQELLEFLNSESAVGESLGIEDIAVIDRLLTVGMTKETIAALILLPLVRIAWSDGEMQDVERDAILQAAHDDQILKGSPSHRILESWLREPPKLSLLNAWSDYARALARELDATSLEKVRHHTIERARRIATTFGGLLGDGIGSKISKNEEMVLHDLSRCFDKLDETPLQL